MTELRQCDLRELAGIDGGGRVWDAVKSFGSDVVSAAKQNFWCGVAGVATSAAAGPALGLAAFATCKAAT